MPERGKMRVSCYQKTLGQWLNGYRVVNPGDDFSKEHCPSRVPSRGPISGAAFMFNRVIKKIIEIAAPDLPSLCLRAKGGIFGALIRSGLQPILSFVPLPVAHM